MTRRNVQVLAAIVAGLVLLLLVLDSTDDSGSTGGERRLLPELEPVANSIREIAIRGPGETEPVVIGRSGEAWVVASRAGYPADIGKLRQLVVALAEATIVEEKTANPENYDRLGLVDPEAGGNGTRVTLDGDETTATVILGEPVRGDFRYARVADIPQTYLIDRNPETPAAASDWLFADIIDIGAERIRKVTISHADGETIVIERDEPEAGQPGADEAAANEPAGNKPAANKRGPADFTVRDLPEGRELAYATVANGIAGALANLELSDVRPAGDGNAATTTVFETLDGETITVTIRDGGGGTWAAFAADPDVDGLNERAAGWEYRLPDFKKNLLVRRWDDLLKAESGGDAGGNASAGTP